MTIAHSCNTLPIIYHVYISFIKLQIPSAPGRAPSKEYLRKSRYRHPIYFGDDLTDLPREVEIDGTVLDDAQTEGYV